MNDDRIPIDEARGERLERYRAGRLDREEREAFERELLADDALAGALYEGESLDALVRRRPRARVPWRALAVAAVLVLVAGVAWWGGRRPVAPGGGDVTRGTRATVRLLEPADGAASARRFVWTRDAGAESYRFELSDDAGRVVAVRLVRDTLLDAATLGAPLPRAGRWTVVPIAPDGSERPAASAARFGAAPR